MAAALRQLDHGDKLEWNSVLRIDLAFQLINTFDKLIVPKSKKGDEGQDWH